MYLSTGQEKAVVFDWLQNTDHVRVHSRLLSKCSQTLSQSTRFKTLCSQTLCLAFMVFQQRLRTCVLSNKKGTPFPMCPSAVLFSFD